MSEQSSNQPYKFPKNSRYKPVEIDGKWYVMDMRNPEATPTEESSERDAEVTARVANLFTNVPRYL